MMNSESWSKPNRLGGLRRFAIAISAFNILGHTVFGFEQSIAQPLIAVATCYCLEMLLEFVDSRASGRAPNYAGGFIPLVDFLLSAHITGLAISMLVYANNRLMPIVFASIIAIGSKALFRIPAGNSSRHFLNPSNFGITVTLLLFPWVGIAPPYHFTENLDGIGDWILPGVIVISGTFLNARFTKKLPLIAAWLGAFVLQAGLRSLVLGVPLVSALLPMTGVAFILYTFYMVTDPATTPTGTREQIFFGVAVAAAYGALLALHAVFGLFFALTIVCVLRGASVHVRTLASYRLRRKVLAQAAGEIASVPEEG